MVLCAQVLTLSQYWCLPLRCTIPSWFGPQCSSYAATWLFALPLGTCKWNEALKATMLKCEHGGFSVGQKCFIVVFAVATVWGSVGIGINYAFLTELPTSASAQTLPSVGWSSCSTVSCPRTFGASLVCAISDVTCKTRV